MEEPICVTLDFSKCRYLGEVFLEMRTKMERKAEWTSDSVLKRWADVCFL